MGHMLERCQRFAAHALGRGVRRHQLRELLLKRLQLLEEHVVVVVGYLGSCIDVVEAVVMVESRTKLLDAGLCVCLFHVGACLPE